MDASARCPSCGSEQILLLFSRVCKAECDKLSVQDTQDPRHELSHLLWLSDEFCRLIADGPPPAGWTHVQWDHGGKIPLTTLGER